MKTIDDMRYVYSTTTLCERNFIIMEYLKMLKSRELVKKENELPYSSSITDYLDTEITELNNDIQFEL